MFPTASGSCHNSLLTTGSHGSYSGTMGVLLWAAQDLTAHPFCHFLGRELTHLPAAMTGSFISSLVMGHRNSSGIPTQADFISILSSSTLRNTLLRRPRDSGKMLTY